MNRRDLLTSGIGIGVGLAVAGAVAEAQPKQPQPPQPKPTPPPKADGRAAFVAALQACLAKAQACQAHCEQQLAAGNKEFAHCATAVADALAVGWATHSLAVRKSVSLKKVLEAFVVVAKECSAACLEHKAHFAHGMHLECKECMEACDAAVKAAAAV